MLLLFNRKEWAMTKYTKEQKAEYFAKMRAEWKAAKDISTTKGLEIDAIIMNHGLQISRTGFIIVQSQMEDQGLDGLPYLDAKTFHGWKENGFKVRKGQKSTISGITWIGTTGKKDAKTDDDKKGFAFPKTYHLFHRSQVEAMCPTDDKPKQTQKTLFNVTKKPSTSKFRSMAEALTAKIEDKIRPMTQNPTPKRNQQYHFRLCEGANLQRLQKLLFAMCNCIENDTLPEVLLGITKKADLANLVYKRADTSGGYYSCIVSNDYHYDTPEALSAQKLIEGSREEERQQEEQNEISKMKQNLLLQKIDDFFPTPDCII